MKRILVGVDGSPESKQAAELAAQIGSAMQAHLTLVYVAPIPVPFGPEPYAQSLGQWELAEREYGNGVLREMSMRVAQSGATVDARLESGAPAETLARLARETGADLVAVGHRGRGAVKRLLLGSAADRLAQIAACPVLICRG
jgi:nucleotide-binding universal stress UspA family protein